MPRSKATPRCRRVLQEASLSSVDQNTKHDEVLSVSRRRDKQSVTKSMTAVGWEKPDSSSVGPASSVTLSVLPQAAENLELDLHKEKENSSSDDDDVIAGSIHPDEVRSGSDQEEVIGSSADEISKKRISIRSDYNPLGGFTDQCITEDIVETFFSSATAVQKSQMYPSVDEVLVEQLGSTGVNDLLDIYRGLFDYWYCQLKAGFNLLLYGLGSKLSLLMEFRLAKLSKYNQLIVYGFFPGLVLKDTLSMVTCDILGHEGHFKSVSLQCQFICSSLCHRKTSVGELFLIIHSIDGQPLQDRKTQHALSLLAACPCIHVIASIDHMRAPLLWDEMMMGRFNWIWHQTATYSQYATESSFDKTAMSNKSDELVRSSFTHVMSSLTSNAKGVFEVLATSQLEHKEDHSYVGLSFAELYQKCREKFLVSSDVSLRAQLTEFRDHKLVQFKKGQDGTELLTIPLKTSILEQLM